MKRTLAAALLTAIALALLIGAWAVLGFDAIRREARYVLDQGAHDGEQRAATAVTRALDSLLEREDERPYFHYSNLYHDPRGASAGLSVVPSPLAEGPADPLVAAHFQIDGQGQVTLPTLNDEFPDLTKAAVRAEGEKLRAALAPEAVALAMPVLPHQAAPAPPEPQQVAIATPQPAEGNGFAGDAPPPMAKERKPSLRGKRAPQVNVYSESAYQQNVAPNAVYGTVQAENAYAADGPAPPEQPETPPPGKVVERVRPRRSALVVEPTAGTAEVRVTVEGFEYRPFSLAGDPGLVALRRVETPDGTMTQGFLVPLTRLATVASAAASGAHLVPASESCRSPVPLVDRCVAVDGDPREYQFLVDSNGHRFLGQLIPVSALAALAGFLVILLVARSERLARQRSGFAAAAAHELRTPLAGLQLYGEMLAEGLGDPAKHKDYARRVADEAGRLGRVVGNVLGFTQLERGSLGVKASRGDLVPAVSDSVERLRGPLAHAGIALLADMPDSLEARFDPDALARILQNLIDNAEKYGRGAADRRIIVRVAPEDDRVTVRVIDHGPGVPPRLARKLFSPFARGTAATPSGDRPAGLGLGLALARALATQQGGTLRHEPTPGGGATFVLSLMAREWPTRSNALRR